MRVEQFARYEHGEIGDPLLSTLARLATGSTPWVAPRARGSLVRTTKAPRLLGVLRWAGLDSNQGPTDYESAALTN